MTSVERVIVSRSRRARLAALGAVVVVALFLLSVLVATGVAPGLRYANADFLYLEAGWRVVQGQRPHVDFHTSMGAFTPLLFGLAMKIRGANAHAFAVAVPLFGAGVTAWAWAVGSSRLSAALAAAYAILVLAIATGQHALSFGYTDISHVSLVDRFAYAVLALVLVECLAPPRDGEPRSTRVLGGISTGAAVGALFFIKPSFLVPALALVLVSSAYRRAARDRWVAMAGGAAAVAVALFVAARTSPGAVLGDYVDGWLVRQGYGPPGPANLFLAMAQRSSPAASPAKLLEILRVDFWSLLALAGVVAAVPTPVPGVEAAYATRRWLLALAAIVVGFTIPVCLTGWQWGEMPVMAAVAVVLAEQSTRASASVSPGPARDARSAVVAGLVLFLVGSVVLKNAGSVVAAWSLGDAYAHVKGRVRPAADALKGMILRQSDGTCEPERYTEKINDGLQLLGSSAPSSPTLLVADSVDPFTFALHAHPAVGGQLGWRLGSTFSGDDAPAVDEVLRDVNVVLVPKCPEDVATRDVMLDLYGSTLDRDFQEGGSSSAWLMLVRRK